ncbi:MAG: hypothetical protein WD696_12885 [Bryobacteraceae bacterium]
MKRIWIGATAIAATLVVVVIARARTQSDANANDARGQAALELVCAIDRALPEANIPGERRQSLRIAQRSLSVAVERWNRGADIDRASLAFALGTVQEILATGDFAPTHRDAIRARLIRLRHALDSDESPRRVLWRLHRALHDIGVPDSVSAPLKVLGLFLAARSAA